MDCNNGKGKMSYFASLTPSHAGGLGGSMATDFTDFTDGVLFCAICAICGLGTKVEALG
jgi:hypothetical protein